MESSADFRTLAHRHTVTRSAMDTVAGDAWRASSVQCKVELQRKGVYTEREDLLPGPSFLHVVKLEIKNDVL